MQSEKDRIEKEGGLVVWAGTWRVGGVLAVSRAFGDRMLKRYVIATPDIREEWLSSEDDLLILASDGVWDVLSNQVGARHGCCCWWEACVASVQLLHALVLDVRLLCCIIICAALTATSGGQACAMYICTARHKYHCPVCCAL